MAKRTRASRSAHRPGGQGPNRTKKSSGDATSSSEPSESDVSSAEEIGASYSEVEVDEAAVAAVAATTPSKPAEEQPTGRRARRRGRSRTSKKRSEDDLESRAAAETIWVREDLRRIAVVSVVLIAALAVAYIVFGVMDVLGLY